MLKSGIYVIRNLKNGKCYVGQTRDLKKRRYEHFRNLDTNNHGNPYLQNAFNKYGKKNFKFEVVVRAESPELDALEVYYIKFFNSLVKDGWGYNIETGGCLNKELSDETKEKLRQATSALWDNPEYREKTSKAHLGKKITAEAKEKMSIAHKGIKKSPETIQRMKEAQRKVFLDPVVRERKLNAIKNRKPMTEEAKKRFREARANKRKEATELAIQLYRDGYNLKESASKAHVCSKRLREELEKIGIYRGAFTPEHRANISKAQSGDLNKAVQAYIDGMLLVPAARFGHVRTETLSAKLKELGLFRNKISDETRRKMSESAKRRVCNAK